MKGDLDSAPTDSPGGVSRESHGKVPRISCSMASRRHAAARFVSFVQRPRTRGPPARGGPVTRWEARASGVAKGEHGQLRIRRPARRCSIRSRQRAGDPPSRGPGIEAGMRDRARRKERAARPGLDRRHGEENACFFFARAALPDTSQRRDVRAAPISGRAIRPPPRRPAPALCRLLQRWGRYAERSGADVRRPPSPKAAREKAGLPNAVGAGYPGGAGPGSAESGARSTRDGCANSAPASGIGFAPVRVARSDPSRRPSIGCGAGPGRGFDGNGTQHTQDALRTEGADWLPGRRRVLPGLRVPGWSG